MKTLDQLLPGQSAVILRVLGSDSIACRLREMGFVRGEPVCFLRSAPLGDPLSCLVQGSRVAVRRSEAVRVCLHDTSAVLSTAPVSQPPGAAGMP